LHEAAIFVVFKTKLISEENIMSSGL